MTGTELAGRQRLVLKDLTPRQEEIVRLRFAHVQEVETGFRGGNPLLPAAGEPRPAYDPGTTTLADRRVAKVAELSGLGREEAALLGLSRVSVRTLQRWAAACRREGVVGCADGHWTRRSGGHPAISELVREAIFAVRAETLHRSRMSMRSTYRLIAQYVGERFGEKVAVPSYSTVRRVWREWFGPGGSRQRYVNSGVDGLPSGGHVIVHRPGQVVALDTTVLPVKVLEAVFGQPTSAHLSVALDVYTHSVVGFRLTLVSDTSVDIAMMLRDVMTPKPMRPGWGKELLWAYPGVTANTMQQLAGYPVAAIPFLTPETVTVDHGGVYKNHHLVEAQRVIGVNILPARVLRPTDKHAVERAFAAIQSLLFELLPGWQGIDAADRGVDPESDAMLTLTEIENLFATWLVSVWQQRALGEYAPAWDPGGTHSPNSLFAAAGLQGGVSVRIPPEDLYYQLLPATHVKIHGRRGVKVRGLWYDGPALDPYRHEVSARGGQHKGRWVVHHDRRDARYVFFPDPCGGWHKLNWVGLPPDGELPAFGDSSREQLLRAVREAGLAPKSDSELLPVLLDLLGANTPVDSWPGKNAKPHGRRHSREITAAQVAQTDRAERYTHPALRTTGDPDGAESQWGQRIADAQEVIDAQRRRRREKAVPQTPAPPPRLGVTAAGRSLLVLPGDEGRDARAGRADE